MQKSVLAVSAAALLAAGCGSQKETLHVFTWSEYIDPDLVERFEEENDCRVKIDIFDSNESMRAKIQQGAAGYDLLTPSSYMVKELALGGFLEKLDHSKIPNLANISASFQRCALDPSMEYGIPYMVTYTGFAYRDDKVSPPPEATWAVFEKRTDLAGHTTLLGDARETIGAALLYNGHSINSTDPAELAEARDTVIRWKKNIAKFENEQFKSGIASGEFLLVHGYSGDIGQAQLDDDGNPTEDNNHITFVLPKEGFSLSCDEFVIPAAARNKELAYKFIDFIHDGEVAAQNMMYTAYWCPNSAAMAELEKTEDGREFLQNPTVFLPEDELARGEVIGYLGDNLELYNKTWDEIRSAE